MTACFRFFSHETYLVFSYFLFFCVCVFLCFDFFFSCIFCVSSCIACVFFFSCFFCTDLRCDQPYLWLVALSLLGFHLGLRKWMGPYFCGRDLLCSLYPCWQALWLPSCRAVHASCWCGNLFRLPPWSLLSKV